MAKAIALMTTRTAGYRSDPIFIALKGFPQDPLRGLAAALAVIESRIGVDPVRWHLSMDTLCLYLLDRREFLDVARALAERLVAFREDSCHCEMLARSLAAQGDEKAAPLFERARSLSDAHEP